MFNSDDLRQRYHDASSETLAKWLNHPGSGKVMEQGFYDPHKFAISSGIKPLLTEPLRHLLHEINELAKDDPLADAMPFAGLHFTFLAITMPLYQRSDIASIDPWLHEAFTKLCSRRPITIHNLRLVALPNQLLLAGIPDTESHYAKAAFSRQLLNSPWREKLRQRHGDIPLPPPFWHGTLLRYKADFIPEYFRAFFLKNQTQDYGDVSAVARLVFTNYNWTEVYDAVSDSPKHGIF